VPSSPPRPGLPFVVLLSALAALSALSALGACGPAPGQARLDLDHDNWISPWDCDDSNPLVNPGANELCNGVDDDCNGEVDEDQSLDAVLYYLDGDGDGYGVDDQGLRACEPPARSVSVAGDCDDADPDRSPAADERCDGQDDDCDGLVDEADAVDAPTWYLDADRDGYGTPLVPTDACSQPEGYVASNADCDDADAAVNPAATEMCDPADVDEDCNGLADDADTAALGLTAWYLDGDGDGYGQDGDVLRSCEPPAGRAERGADCDDTDSRVHPGAPEQCANGRDDDCNGLIDGSDPGATVDVALYADRDADGFGDPASQVGSGCDLSAGISAEPTDCDDADATVHPGATETWYDGIDQDCSGGSDDDADGDGFAAATVGGSDCDDADPAVHPGAIEACDNGIDDDCDGVVDPCAVSLRWDGAAGSRLGGALAAGDVDGDGSDELVLGAGLAGDAGQGAAYLLTGPVAGGDLGAAVRLDGSAAGDHVAAALAVLGDQDGGGYGAVVVGAADADLGGGAGSGGAYVLGGPLSAGGDVADLAQALLVGEDVGDGAGTSLAALADLDGDGWPDLALGAPLADPSGSRTGAVYLLSGARSGTVDLWGADGRWLGEDAGDQAGAALADAGDVDGDGLTDVILGAPQRRGDDLWAGGAYLLPGPATGQGDLADATARLLGTAGGDQAGAAVAGAGDVDGDGYADVLVGAPGRDLGGSGSGAAYLLRGPLVGDRALSSAELILVGATAEDAAGSAVAGGLDLDGDGLVDLAIGARSDDAGTTNAGAVYLVLAPEDGSLDLSEADLRLVGTVRDQGLGGVLVARGDPSGDGAPDLLLGVPLDAEGGADAGAGWIITAW